MCQKRSTAAAGFSGSSRRCLPLSSTLCLALFTVLVCPLAEVYAGQSGVLKATFQGASFRSATVQEADHDGDGIANTDDVDDDNDGIFDRDEGLNDVDRDGIHDATSTDTDGDGLYDGLDLDSDNDGIPDNVESRIDLRSVQALDQDLDGVIDAGVPLGRNGIADVLESTPDSNRRRFKRADVDRNGVPDFRDPDADGDGLDDRVEAGALGSTPLDTDGDGIPDFRDIDSDNDGIRDSDEDVPTGIANPPDDVPLSEPVVSGPDRDGDGVFDQQDLDDDNDGLTDADELLVDADGDGLADAGSRDSDADGVPDGYDLDSDNDGIPDLVEGQADTDGDGQPDFIDAVNDGTSTATDQDADGDGLSDALESGFDSDGDGVDNQFDLDSDNDGIIDATEAFGSGPPGPSPLDSDGDGVYDYLDLDSDNDSAFDAYESDHLQVTSDGRLVAAASVDASGLARGLAGEAGRDGVVGAPDSDSDGVPDYRDLDSDNDGLIDLVELGGVDQDGDARIDGFDDAAGDGADDDIQKFVAEWIDTDGDSIPDMRDLDSDNDGLSDIFEAHGLGADADGDGRLDLFDDQNVDGLDDNVAALGTHVRDTDGDGLPDQTDADSDNDGIYDLAEAGGADTDGDGMIDDDMDLIANGFGGPFVGEPDRLAAIPDSDGDGIPDFQDASAQDDDLLGTAFVVGESSTGSGCSIASVGFGGSGSGKFDLGLVLLFIVGLWHAMKRRRAQTTALVTLASALALVGCTSTDEPDADDFDGRFYVGGGLLASQLEPDASDDDRLKIDEDQSGGGSISLGYDVSNRFTVEGHVAALGEASFDPDGEIAYQVGGLSALLYGFNHEDDRALREGFSAFARIGAGTLQNQADDIEYERINDVHLLGGAGLEYGFANGLALRGEFVAHDTDARYAQLGVLYRFGDVRESVSTVAALDSDVDEAAADVELDEKIGDATADMDDTGAALESAVDDAGSAVTTPVPTTPRSVQPESLDADDDGIVDETDECPDTRSGALVDRAGCAALDGVLEGVLFEPGSDTLMVDAQRELDVVLQVLTDNPAVVAVIAAHTDNQGTARSNLELSGRRALRVARYLADRGIEPQRLKPKAYGESRPLAVNSTAAGRKLNRRVEVTVAE